MNAPKTTLGSLVYIDITPDEEYPLRILEAHRKNCNVCRPDETNDPNSSTSLHMIMNLHCVQRAAHLDHAIALLRRDIAFTAAVQTDSAPCTFGPNRQVSASPLDDIKAAFDEFGWPVDVILGGGPSALLLAPHVPTVKPFKGKLRPMPYPLFSIAETEQ